MKISVENIGLSYDEKQILKNVSIHAENKEFVGLIGPNGSGKSTLLKCIYRVLKPQKGAVYLGEESLDAMSYKSSARKMAVVAQHNYYNFDFSVWEVVLMGRSPHKKAMERENIEDFRIVEEALKKVGMYHFRQRSFSTLSGGEQQRVAIARAIVNEPAILLADEPTGNLDPTNSWEIMSLLKEANDRGTTVLVVTHNQEIVNEMNERVITMKQGVIVSDEQKGGYIDED